MDMEPTGRCCMPRSCSGLLDDLQAPGSTSCLRSFINSWLGSATGVESRGCCELRVLESFVVGIRWPSGEVPLDSMDALQTSVRHQSNSRDCRELPSAMGRMGQKSWLLPQGCLQHEASQSRDFLIYRSRFSVSSAVGFHALSAVLLLPDLAPLSMFTRVLSER